MVRLTDRPDMTLDVYRGRKTTIQQQQHERINITHILFTFYFRPTYCMIVITKQFNTILTL